MCYYAVIKASLRVIRTDRAASELNAGSLSALRNVGTLEVKEKTNKQAEGAFQAARSGADIDLRARSDHIHKRFGEENMLRLLLCLLVWRQEQIQLGTEDEFRHRDVMVLSCEVALSGPAAVGLDRHQAN